MTGKILRELLFFINYLVISFIATSVGFDRWDVHQREGYSESFSSVSSLPESTPEINVVEMLSNMWKNYYRYWLVTFLILSAARFIVWLMYEKLFNSKSLK